MLAVLAGGLMTACSTSEQSNSEPSSTLEIEEVEKLESESEVNTEASMNETEEVSESQEESTLVEMGGNDELCSEHDIDYHAIDNDLILYVGRENFTAWQDTLNGWDSYGRYHEEQTIDAFVNHFGISRETLVSMCDYYSEDQLDAIYSGDQSQINEAFCGDLAYYNPSDGQLYSIYWLSGHTYEDYREADLPTIEIDKILTRAGEMGGIYAQLAETAWLEQREYVGVTETSPVYDTCMEHVPSFHAVPYELILWIGTDVFYEWEETLPYETDEFGRPDEDFTIVEVVEQFNISKEDFLEATRSWMTDEAMDNIGMTREEYLEKVGYTDAQVDAIYSGDQSQINEAFCGDLAYYNPSDGQLYSIYWLSDHTAADYQAAGVPVSEVERILDDASAMGGSYASLAEAAAPAAEAYALE